MQCITNLYALPCHPMYYQTCMHYNAMHCYPMDYQTCTTPCIAIPWITNRVPINMPCIIKRVCITMPCVTMPYITNLYTLPCHALPSHAIPFTERACMYALPWHALSNLYALPCLITKPVYITQTSELSCSEKSVCQKFADLKWWANLDAYRSQKVTAKIIAFRYLNHIITKPI